MGCQSQEKGYEIDFLIKESDKITHLIQVTKNVEENNRDRELRAFAEACEELEYIKDIKLLLISFEATKPIKYKNLEIKMINIFDWLLLENDKAGDGL